MALRNVAVFGGNGFIGGYLVKLLQETPELKVRVIYNKSSPKFRFKNVKYIKFSSKENLLDQCDLVIILTQPNLELIKYIQDYSQDIKRIIFGSTLLLYKDSLRKHSEESEVNPITDYEKQKAKEETLLIQFVRKQNKLLTIARIGNVYGDVKNLGIVQKIVSATYNKLPFSVNNSGDQIRDYIFVEDVAKYLKFLIINNQEFQVEIFNICSGRGYSINELISEVEKTGQIKLKRIEGVEMLEKKSIVGDNGKIIKAAGFLPEYSLESGLKKTFENFLRKESL